MTQAFFYRVHISERDYLVRYFALAFLVDDTRYFSPIKLLVLSCFSNPWDHGRGRRGVRALRKHALRVELMTLSYHNCKLLSYASEDLSGNSVCLTKPTPPPSLSHVAYWNNTFRVACPCFRQHDSHSESCASGQSGFHAVCANYNDEIDDTVIQSQIILRIEFTNQFTGKIWSNRHKKC